MTFSSAPTRSDTMRDRYTIAVSAEPGRCKSFRWEIVPPGKSDPRLESGYVFTTRRAAILDARFFLLREGRFGILDRTVER